MGATADTVGRTVSATRVPELDGLRGVAVLLVLFHHIVIYSNMSRDVFLDINTFKLAASTWIGVDLFFVLSGFLITGILYDSKNSKNYFRNFYSRRALRIFPLYFGFLLLSLAAAPSLLSADASANLIDGQFWFWTYLSNVYIVVENGWPDPLHLNHFWSLAIEEQFYFLWPLAVLAFGRQQLLQLSFACLITALALRISLPLGMSPLDSYVLLPTRMDGLAAGAIVALLIRSDEGQDLVRTWSTRSLLATCFLIFALFQRRWILSELDPLVRTLGYTLVAVAAASLIGMLVTAKDKHWLRRAFSMPLLMRLGKYSYGIYVLHHPLILLLRDAGFDARILPHMFDSSLPGVLVFATTVVCLTLIAAMFSYHCWERPFLKLKRLFPYQRKTDPTKTEGNSSILGAPNSCR